MAVSAPLYGQARDTGSVYGSVTDAQGAVVPAAPVTIVNSQTGLTRTATTDSNGGFVVTLLPVGTYNLTVEQTGVRKSEKRGIVLQANENIRVDVALQVGNVQETVSVEAAALQVDTRSATVSQ